MTGIDKAREVAARIKSETDEEEKIKEEGKQIALNQLTQMQKNPELSKMYAENVTLGAGNLAGELPLLKVHQVGKSHTNELVNGEEPIDGYFFYKSTGEQFKELECHILTISKGFRAPGIEGKGEVFNQIVGGIIGDSKPFIMYMTGLKLSHLWEFGKAAHKYTHAKPIGIPMFALTVRLTTEKIKNNFGSSWIVKFEIVKDSEGTPNIIMDPGEFQYLKYNVETLEDTISSLIAAKTNKEQEEQRIKPIEVEDEQPLNPSDIPF